MTKESKIWNFDTYGLPYSSNLQYVNNNNTTPL